jgi:hypothetical protein
MFGPSHIISVQAATSVSEPKPDFEKLGLHIDESPARWRAG